MIFKPADQLLIDAIKRHGALPTHYLYEFSKHVRGDYTGFKKRLKELVDAGLLRRPPTLNNPLIHTDHFVYDVPEGNDHADYLHALMNSTITSNIELEAVKAGFAPVPRQDFGRVSLKTDSDYPTVPDAVFGIHYGKMRRFFVLETDRGTEAINPRHKRANSIRRKLQAYNYILENDSYKPLPQPWVLFVTTSEARMENMIAEASALFPKGSKRILFNWAPGFLPYHRTPPLFPKLFGEYKRAGHEPLDISKP